MTANLKELQANARLIAAAPEMLEALKLSLGLLRQLGAKDSNTFTIIAAAIAKATGGGK